MPSLPELEVYKAQLTEKVVGRPVAGLEPLDWRVIRAEIARLEALLVGRSVQSVERYGKWLIFGLGAPENLLIHLGLTGKLKLIAPDEKLPRFSCFAAVFADGGRLVFADQRKLGRLYLRDFAELKAEKALGPDLLSIKEDYYTHDLRRKRRGVRDVLMDQKIIAGIGGKYADEILWQARLHPNTKLDKLTEAKLGELYRLSMDITRQAIALDADVERFPSNWLIPHRHTDKLCPNCGEALVQRKFGGSEAYYCPKDQPTPNPFRSG
jgi:formamidopyrimidine-DNA glycosylase